MKKYALFLSYGILIVSFATTATASAKAFVPGNIIDDSIFTNKSSMNTQQIQQFFDAKGAYCINGEAPCLKNFSENGRSAAQIVYDTAQQFNINPQTLIVTLQKEVGLVTLSQPAAWRYRTAMGYGCPDTAACDTQYYGFTNQVYWAARMFNAIMTASPTWYTPYILGNNYIQYNPSTSCGGSMVYIQNRATQALYNYTPYQPNAAALAAGYGTAPCGAYGNRNFWLYFNDWFGSTSGSDIKVVYKESGSPQYLLNDNKRYLISDTSTKIAWNLHLLPDTPLPDAVVDSVPYVGALDRYVQSNYTGQLYVIDSQRRYPVRSLTEMANFSNTQPISVSRYLIDYLIDGPSFLSPFITRPDGSVYVMDGGKVRRLADQSTVNAWQKDYSLMNLSDAFFNSFPNSTDISGFKLSAQDKIYLIDEGSYRLVPNDVAPAIPGNVNTISAGLFAFLRNSNKPSLSKLIQSTDSGIVYYANGNDRFAIPTMGQLISLSPRGALSVSMVSPYIMSLFSTSRTLSTHFISDSGNTYLLVGGYKRKISSEVLPDFVGSPSSAVALNVSQLPEGELINDTLIHQDNGRVLILSNGTLYYIPDLTSYVLWGGESRKGTYLPSYVMQWIQEEGSIGRSFSVGSKTYMFTNKKQVNPLSETAKSILASSSSPVLSSIPQGITASETIIDRKLSLNNGESCVLTSEGAFCSSNANLKVVWNIPDSPVKLSLLAINHLPIYPLTQFVESRTIPEVGISIKTVDSVYHLKNPGQVYNAGWNGQKRVPITEEDLTSSPLVLNWNNLLIQNSSTKAYFTLINGVFYPVSNSLAAKWAVTPAQLQTADIALLPISSSPITNSFQRNGDSRVLTITEGKTSWVRSLGTYSQYYFPLTPVSSSYADQLPMGPDIP